MLPYKASETARRPFPPWVALLAMLPLLCVAGPASATPDTVIRVGGTGGALAAMKQVGEAFRKADPDCRLNILPSLGSGGGIKALLAGTLDVAVSARPLTAEERRQGAKETPYGRSPFVFVTSLESGVPGVTTRQLVEIYSGRTVAWPDGRQIRLVLRPEGDADTAQLLSISPEMERAVREALGRKGMAVALSDQEAADLMENAPGSLGTTVLSLVLSEKRSLRVLPLDGVAPGVKTLASGSYPHARTFYAVTGPKSPASALRFVTFLKSPEGRKVLGRTGHLTED